MKKHLDIENINKLIYKLKPTSFIDTLKISYKLIEIYKITW